MNLRDDAFEYDDSNSFPAYPLGQALHDHSYTSYC